MGGIELRGNTLVVDRSPSDLDDLAVSFSALLSEHDVDHAFVAGYVAILTGRARSTEDIDVIVERMDRHTIDSIVDSLEAEGYWGPAMPLAEMAGNLARGANIWVAREDEVTPHLEVKYATDRFDRASLGNSIQAQIGDATIPVGPLELQIAYKLYLGTQKDFEDAVHLHELFEESLSTRELEDWVESLEVQSAYGRLRGA